MTTDGAAARQRQDDAHVVGADGLTGREHAILDFERQWWKFAGAKEEAIKTEFDLSATRCCTPPPARSTTSPRSRI